MPVTAQAATRSLKLYNLHTHEKAEIVYKRNGRYVPDGLKKINHFLRDWRRNEVVKMDPRLLDLVWAAYRESGSTNYIHVICGYRAPATNAMLRSRSRGVAKKSQHMLGTALDFYIPGVPLKKLRNIGLKMQGGGVGYYPSSGSPFVHMDVGNVRHWPGISRKELVALFPDGKTLHVPSDGKPLPGYQQALAAYKSRKASGTPNIQLASAGDSKKSGGLLASLFGGGADQAEDEAEIAVAARAPKKAVKPAAGKAPLPGIKIVSPEEAQRADIPAAAPAAPEAAPSPETIIASLPARSIPLPDFAPRPKVEVGVETPETVPFRMADASEAAAAKPAPGETTPAEPTDMPFGMAAANDAGVIDPVAASSRVTMANMVPLPTWRPDRATTPAELVPANQEAVLLALADTTKRENAASAVLSTLPARRPDEIRGLLENAASEEGAGATDSYQVASLSPAPRSVFSDPQGVDAASPRLAIAARPEGSDPVAAIGGNVKTTRKEARATPRDARPDPKALVVSAEPELARWALHGEPAVSGTERNADAPKLAYNLVRTAPTTVYTMGFQSADAIEDAHRFTGSAVKFLAVAKFSK